MFCSSWAEGLRVRRLSRDSEGLNPLGVYLHGRKSGPRGALKASVSGLH